MHAKWVLDKKTFGFMESPGQEFTVGQVGQSGRLALQSSKEAHIRNAANEFTQRQQTIQIKDPDTGEEGPYHVVM